MAASRHSRRASDAISASAPSPPIDDDDEDEARSSSSTASEPRASSPSALHDSASSIAFFSSDISLAAASHRREFDGSQKVGSDALSPSRSDSRARALSQENEGRLRSYRPVASSTRERRSARSNDAVVAAADSSDLDARRARRRCRGRRSSLLGGLPTTTRESRESRMGPDLPITLVWRRWDDGGGGGETIIAVVVVVVVMAVVVVAISERRTTDDARDTIVE